jgi:hypothetical protein
MANPTTPYGFQDVNTVEGVSPNFGIVRRPMGASVTASIYIGDPAILTAGLPALATTTGATGAGLVGVFQGFEWPSLSFGGTRRDRAWLGATTDIVAGGQLYCYLSMNPQNKFKARVTGASNNPITNAMLGQLVNFAVGAGPGGNLISTYSIDAATVTATSTTLPWKIYEILGQPNTDPTSPGNEIIVVFNPASFVLI